METFHAYEVFSRMITEDNIYLDSTLSFGFICRLLNANRSKLDRLIKLELGMSGQEVLNYLKKDALRTLCSKYSIKGFNL